MTFTKAFRKYKAFLKKFDFICQQLVLLSYTEDAKSGYTAKNEKRPHVPLTKDMLSSRTGMIRTVRERSAPGAKWREPAWWLRAARRDPNGTPEISYWMRRQTSTTVAASQSSTQATRMKTRAITEQKDSNISRSLAFGGAIPSGRELDRDLGSGGLWQISTNILASEDVENWERGSASGRRRQRRVREFVYGVNSSH